MEKCKPKPWAFWQIWRWTFFVLVLLFFINVGVYYALSQHSKSEQRRFFYAEGRAYIIKIRSSVYADLQRLTSLSLGFRLNNYVPLRDMQVYMENMRFNVPQTVMLEWFPLVLQQNIPKFLFEIRKIYPQYQYQGHQFDNEKTGQALLQRPYIFPLAFVYPDTAQYTRNLGFIFAGAVRDKYISDIMSGCQQVVTAPISLWDTHNAQSEGKNGFLVINAVHGIHDQRLMGIFVSVINMHAYFSHLTERINPRKGTVIQISDVTSGSEIKLFSSKKSESAAVGSSHVEFVEYLSLGSRKWKITITGDWALYAENMLLLKILWWVGLVISLLVSLIVGYAVNRTGLYEFLLQQRTRELEFMLEHDHLTRVLNRRAYDRLLRECCLSGRPFTLFMIDMDYFKRINDGWGHAAGDAALIEVALRLQPVVGSGTYVARIGGDEFAVITPITDPTAIAALGEQMLQAIREPDFSFRQQTILLSITLGVAVYHKGQNPDQIQDCADQALYAAKQRGRGCCVQYV